MQPDLKHQQEAIDATLQGFAESSAGQLHMACGTGKTRVGLRVAERLKSARTVLFSPSIALVAQSIREWRAHAAEPFDMCAVCCDSTVGDDDIAVTELVDAGVHVTTNSLTLAELLKKKCSRLVVFATYTSSEVVAEALRIPGVPRFNFMICDEAHRCAGRADGLFTTVHAVPSVHRLFMTATPRVFSLDGDEENVLSMDDPQRFGPVFYSLNFSEAVRRGLLTDYKIVVAHVTSREVEALLERNPGMTFGAIQGQAKAFATHIAIHKTMKQHHARKCISFHSRVRTAAVFANLHEHVARFIDGTDVHADHINGTMSSRSRCAKLEKFDSYVGDYAVVTNAKCLGEGVDVPVIDAIAFTEPIQSTTSIVQGVGRASRLSPGKKTGLVIVPIFIGPDDVSTDGAAPSDSFSGTPYENLANVLFALRACDDSLSQIVSAIPVKRAANVRQDENGELVFPRLVAAANFDPLTMRETSEETDNTLVTRDGRVYDLEGFERVITLPDKVEVLSDDAVQFVSSIEPMLVQWGGSNPGGAGSLTHDAAEVRKWMIANGNTMPKTGALAKKTSKLQATWWSVQLNRRQRDPDCRGAFSILNKTRGWKWESGLPARMAAQRTSWRNVDTSQSLETLAATHGSTKEAAQIAVAHISERRFARALTDKLKTRSPIKPKVSNSNAFRDSFKRLTPKRKPRSTGKAKAKVKVKVKVTGKKAKR